jgi:hypothetical protein
MNWIITIICVVGGLLIGTGISKLHTLFDRVKHMEEYLNEKFGMEIET